jgi:hypothetical protein
MQRLFFCHVSFRREELPPGWVLVAAVCIIITMVTQAHVRGYLDRAEHHNKVVAVATISERVKLWLQIRRAVAAELEAEIQSATSESFYSEQSGQLTEVKGGGALSCLPRGVGRQWVGVLPRHIAAG